MNNIFLDEGGFFTGCNYWASHAGTAMWSDWRPDVVEQDLRRLSEAGLKVLRVFPLWPDFQPVCLLRGYTGRPVEFRIGEEALTDDEEGVAGVSREAIGHFEYFAQTAHKYGLQLVVALITGWMSGRLFVPPALEGLNILKDPLALQWETRFVKYFVKHFKTEPSIIAWDLGNECNCMAEVSSPQEAWNWVSCITCAIKSEDPERLVISGMHSLKTEGNWTIKDQAEIVDILTTHPYPSPTYNSHQDPMNTIRPGLHSSAQSLLYRGVGEKPCFAEEVGTFGPMFSNEKIAADFIRNNLFSLWIHDCRGFLWWCANEQSHLKHAPYDWDAIERELGLFRLDGTPKPVVGEISGFTSFVRDFTKLYGKLPERKKDGICILTKGMGGDGAWAAAYSAFVLAKQAGLEIEFRQADQPLEESPLYIMPSVKSWQGISRRRMNELLEKVKAGSVLYISVENGVFSPFTEFSGIEVATREKCMGNEIISISDPLEDGKIIDLEIRGSFKYRSRLTRALKLGEDKEGTAVFTCAQYGRGKVYFLSYPLELYLFDRPGVFNREGSAQYWKIYAHIRKGISAYKRHCTSDDVYAGITEHHTEDGRIIIAAINYKPERREIPISIAKGWKPAAPIYGKLPEYAADKAADAVADKAADKAADINRDQEKGANGDNVSCEATGICNGITAPRDASFVVSLRENDACMFILEKDDNIIKMIK
ncbi:MAG: hypothetical protein PHG48_04765 [Eubacteriales bacterium]|nr:hypothetical protein [Eubacteriales bacterium]